MTPSIVAMFGWIIPAPLEMPVTVMVRPSMTTWRDTALGTVSVVMIASAAEAQFPGERSAMHAGRPSMMRSTGSASMMTPVESRSTSGLSRWGSRATAWQVARALAMPSAPVPALATPVFTTIARIGPLSARCSRHTMMGAAAKRLRVNTAATRAPSSSATRSRSLRLGLRMPAFATPRRTPAMVRRFSGRGASRLTAILAAILHSQPLRPDPRHAVGIDVLSGAQRVRFVRAFDLEAEFPEQGDRALVVDEHGVLDPNVFEPIVGESHQRLQKRRAAALARHVLAHECAM